MDEVLRKENEFVAVRVNENCEVTLLDKASGTEWNMGSVAFQEQGRIVNNDAWVRNERSFCEFYAGHFKAEKVGDDLRVILMGPPNDQVMGSFSCQINLTRDYVEFRPYDIDEGLESLVFPAPIKSESLIVPNGPGKWVKKDQPTWECFFLHQHHGGVNMRWMGGLKSDEKHGWIMILTDDYADTGFYTTNLSASPAWLKSMGKWGEKRAVRYQFTSDGYVGMTKIYRDYLKEAGLFKTLKDKIEENPAVANLLGGRILSFFQCHTLHKHYYLDQMLPVPPHVQENDGKVDVKITHADVAEVIREAKALGMKKGLFNLRGTFKGGYDESHPDIWPPEPALGTLDELKAIIAENPSPYLLALHDNYQDIYPSTPSFPKGCLKNEHGDLLPGGPWHGGICFINCPAAGFDYAKRNWEELQTLGLNSYFADTAACATIYECYDPDHPLTRTQDAQAKRKLMQFYKDQGLVLGSEDGSDFSCADIDFLETRHHQVPGESIPLWSLVFHDSVICARYGTQGTTGGQPARMLENMLWGYSAYWPVNSLADWKTQKEAFVNSFYVDEWHQKIGLDEMTRHTDLSGDGTLEQTEFSSGHAIIVNFADEDREIDGKPIPANDYLIRT